MQKLPLFLALTVFSFPAYSTGSNNWEYLAQTFQVVGDGVLTRNLNSYGNEQWELVNCTTEDAKLICIFKRPQKNKQK